MTCLQRWDGGNIAGAAPGSQWVLMLGRYWYDDNPFIGTLANINMWSRTMDTGELRRRTRCLNEKIL